jgi:tetratricopeptide (TPR) repeat protein
LIKQCLSDGYQDAETFHVCGELLWRQGAFEQAVDMVSKSLEIDPFNSYAYFIRGDCYVQLQQYEQGRSEMQKYLKLEQPSIDILLSLGKCNATMGNLEEALANFSKVIEMEPEADPYYYFLRGDLYTKLNQKEKARQDFNKIIELDPNFVKPYEQNAQECIEKGDIKGAISIYLSLLKIDPERPEYYLNCGLLYYELNDLEQALELITSCVELISNIPESSPRSDAGQEPSSFDIKSTQTVYSTRGKIYFEMHDLENAIKDLTKSITIASEKKNVTEIDDLTLVESLKLRGESYILQREIHQAKDDYERITSEFKDEMCNDVQMVYKFLAEYYYDITIEYDKALKAFMSCWKTGTVLQEIVARSATGFPHNMTRIIHEHDGEATEEGKNSVVSTPGSKPQSKHSSRQTTPSSKGRSSRSTVSIKVEEETIEEQTEKGWGHPDQYVREMFAHCLVLAFIDYQTEQKRLKEEEEARQAIQTPNSANKKAPAPKKEDKKGAATKGAKPEQIMSLFEIALNAYVQPYNEILGVYREPVVAFREKWAFYEEKFLGKLPPQPGEIPAAISTQSRVPSAKKTTKDTKPEPKKQSSPTKKK